MAGVDQSAASEGRLAANKRLLENTVDVSAPLRAPACVEDGTGSVVAYEAGDDDGTMLSLTVELDIELGEAARSSAAAA